MASQNTIKVKKYGDTKTLIEMFACFGHEFKDYAYVELNKIKLNVVALAVGIGNISAETLEWPACLNLGPDYDGWIYFYKPKDQTFNLVDGDFADLEIHKHMIDQLERWSKTQNIKTKEKTLKRQKIIKLREYQDTETLLSMFECFGQDFKDFVWIKDGKIKPSVIALTIGEVKNQSEEMDWVNSLGDDSDCVTLTYFYSLEEKAFLHVGSVFASLDVHKRVVYKLEEWNKLKGGKE